MFIGIHTGMYVLYMKVRNECVCMCAGGSDTKMDVNNVRASLKKKRETEKAEPLSIEVLAYYKTLHMYIDIY